MRRSDDDAESAIDNAVVRCIEDGGLKNFLLKNRTEVLDVCITEFNKEIYEEGILNEGIEMGRAEERLNLLERMLTAGIITKEQAAQFS